MSQVGWTTLGNAAGTVYGIGVKLTRSSNPEVKAVGYGLCGIAGFANIAADEAARGTDEDYDPWANVASTIASAGVPLALEASLAGVVTLSPVGWVIAGIFLGTLAGELTSETVKLLDGHNKKKDPLIFDMNFDGIRLSKLYSIEDLRENTSLPAVYFDFDGDGFAERTGWLSPKDAFLTLDANQNGIVDDGSELFGNAREDGYSVLRAYDINSDGHIDNNDGIYSSLKLWFDINQDGYSQPGELKSLAEGGISSISLYASSSTKSLNGNDILYESNYTRPDSSTSESMAVAFATDLINTRFEVGEEFTIDPDVFSLPNLRGYGSMPDLWIAMCLDPTLKEMVQDLVDLLPSIDNISSIIGHPYVVETAGTSGQAGFTEYHYEAGAIEDIVARWAGVEISNGNSDEVQIEEIAEKLTNREMLPGLGAGNSDFHAIFQVLASDLASKMLVQVSHADANQIIINTFANVVNDVIADGPLTEAQMDLIASDIEDQVGEQPALTGILKTYSNLEFDFFKDEFAGDKAGFIDALLEQLPFDSQSPWASYADWYAENRLELNAVDPKGDLLAQEHRKMTGNLALNILTSPHADLTGDATANTISGDQGGTAYPDLIKGLGGNDTLQGGGGSDTYVMSDGAGSDTITDTSGTSDELAFQGSLTSTLARYSFADSAHQDLLIEFDGRSESVLIEDYFTSTGDATIEHITFPDGPKVSHRDVRDAVYDDLGTSGNDTITGFVLGTTIDGKGGNDLLSGQGDSDKLIGGAGNDTLESGGGNDTLEGGTGNDVLKGHAGNDSYLFNVGDGQDTLSEYESSASGNDTLFLGEGIAPEDVTITQADNGYDFILTFAGSTDQITLDNTNIADAYRIDQLQFADGTIWSFTDMFERSITPTSGNDLFYGSSDSDVMAGEAGNDRLEGRGGNDRLTGGAGNDSLYGNAGDDTFVFGIGDGQDVATEYDGGGFDTVLLGAGITPGDITVEQADNGLDMIVKINGTADQITLDNTNTGNATYKVDQIGFNDSTVWSFADLLAHATTATSGADIFWGDETANALSGSAGNDTLTGNGGNDTLAGGTGNDVLYGNAGNDTFVFNLGDGQDVATEYGESGTDTVQLGAGITTIDVIVTQSANGQDIVLSINGTSDKITLQNTIVGNASYKVDQVRFDDGTVWSFADLIAKATTATSGADTFWGDETANAISGGGGNDTLTGNGGDDTLAGGTGNDSLYGNAGDDTFVLGLGDGQDVATEYGESGTDTLQLGAGITPNDLSFQQLDNGQDIVIKINGTTDQITLDNTNTGNAAYRIDQVRFDDGTLWSFNDLLVHVTGGTSGNDNLSGDGYANLLMGGAGNDTLTGNGGDDTLGGGTGNDTLYANGGNDTFLFGLGDGQDVATEYGESGTDTVQLGAGIATTDVTVTQSANGQDIILSINGTTDKITLLNTNVGNPNYKVDQVRFDDGTVWSFADLVAKATTATSGADTFWGDETANAISGGAGNDTLRAGSGNDTLAGGTDNDMLYGNGGDDTYVFGIGDGQDVATEYGESGTDTVQLGAGIATTDVTVTQSNNGQDIILSINGTSDQITLLNTNIGSATYKVDQVRFDDGTLWSWAEILARATQPTSGNDLFYGDINANTLSGSAGDDTLNGSSGNDTLAGGTGNDMLYGSYDNDTYVFGLGDGQDVASEYGYNGTDTVQLGAGIATIDVTVSQSANGQDIILSINGTTDKITLQNTNIGNASYKIDQVRFDDGTVWNFADLIAKATTATSGADAFWGDETANALSGGAGNDTLKGGSGNDTLTGGAGYDYLYGNGGNDTFVFGLGDGQDVATEYGESGTDTVQFGAGIAPSDVLVNLTDSGNDIVLRINGTTDRITLDNTNTGNANYRIDQVAFVDGTVWTFNDLLTLAAQNASNLPIEGTTGNDTLNGTGGADTLYGALGNDSLVGGNGSDTYLYASGDGNDAIFDENTSGGTDVLKLSDLNPADVTLRRDTYHLYIKDNATGQEIQVQYQYHPPYDQGIEQIQFANGTIWGINDINAAAWYRGAGGNDTIYGSSLNETFAGYGGDDYLAGGDGADTYVYSSGNGADTIFDENTTSSLTDTLKLTDLDPGDVTLRRDGYHLYVRDNTTGQELTVQYQYHDPYDQGIERIEFANGTVWDKTRIDQEAWIRGTSGANSLYGTTYDETISGGLGNDYLEGRGGSDTYVYASGDGADSIFDENFYGGYDILKLVDLNASDVTLRTSGYHLYVKDTTTNQEIEIQYQYHPPYDQGIERIDFANGDFWTRNDIATILAGGQVLIGTSGNDTLTGAGTDDRLRGGAGNDSLAGGLGTDVAVYAGNQADYTISTSGGSITITDDQASTDGNDGADTLSAVETAEFKDGSANLAAPIILDLNGDGVKLVSKSASKASFDWDDSGVGNRTGWIDKKDGLLVFDRNGDGKVSSANELSFLDDKPGAKSDLDGLSAFDSNMDGIFSGDDDQFAHFRVWRDKNGNGRSDRGELMTLSQAGVASINLAATATERDWEWNDNLVINTGSFTRTNGQTGAFGDVALNYADDAVQSGRFASSRMASRFAEAIAAFAGRGSDEVTIGKHDMETKKELVFGGDYHARF